MQGVGFHFMHPSPAIGVMGGAQVFMVGGQQEEEVINSQVQYDHLELIKSKLV